MTDELQLIEKLKAARSIPEIARLTAQLLRVCDVFNFQAVGYELSRLGVTGGKL